MSYKAEPIIQLEETEFYSHQQTLTKFLQEIVLDYEFDSSVGNADDVYAALVKVRQHVLTASNGARSSVPHVGMLLVNQITLSSTCSALLSACIGLLYTVYCITSVFWQNKGILELACFLKYKICIYTINSYVI